AAGVDGERVRRLVAGSRHASSDGLSWMSTDISPANLRLGPVAVSDDGVYVGVRGGWQVWYGEQEFYRSDDGVSWTRLDPGSFVGGHPIRAIAFGRAAASALCPGR